MAAVDGRTGQSGAPPDRYCSLSGAPPRHPTVRVLEQLTIEGFVLLWHRIVRCHTRHCPVRRWLLLWLLSPTVHAVSTFCSRPLREVAVAPLVHRTVRWIIAKCACWNPRVARSTLYGPGAPDTVRWHTRQSGAPDPSTLGFFAPLNWIPNLNIYWFVLNHFAPVEHAF
jgi:hypothetical protein